MSNRYQKIGVFAKYNDESVKPNLDGLLSYLSKRGHDITIEEKTAKFLGTDGFPSVPKETLGKDTDLIIVLGGDGSILNAARAVVKYQNPVVGINRGRLGYLTDINPDEQQQKLDEILEGNSLEERRALLQAEIIRDGQPFADGNALNDVVLHTGDIARMIEFEVYINDQFMLQQRSDGIITATPTGSTAYALSGGGPILYPTLNALVLVPMLPHTLSSRPIVIDNNSQVELVITQHNDHMPKVSFDGQLHVSLNAGDRIRIQKSPFTLRLLHPETHDYFAVLREKLGWNANWSSDRYSNQ